MHLSRRYGRTAFVYSRAPDWNKPVPPSHTAGEGKVRSVKKLFVLMAAVLALVTVPASAQDTTGGVAGRIVDSSGLALPGVTVAATGAQGAKTAVSDAEGRYTIPFLIPGVYMIDLTLDGFEPVHRGGIHIELGQALDVSLTMRVGGVTETVQVTANRPLVDTTSAAIGANLDGETLSRLPVGRQFTDTLLCTCLPASPQATAGRQREPVPVQRRQRPREQLRRRWCQHRDPRATARWARTRSSSARSATA